MNPSNEEIYQTLTKREKIYFARFCKLHKLSNNSIILFDHLKKYGHYNNQVLKKELSNKHNIKYLSDEKNSLNEKILLSLINFNFDSSFSWKIFKDIQFVKVLIEKELLNKAQKTLNKAKKNAYQYEEFELLLHIIAFEESLCFSRCFITNYEKLKELKNERNKINDIINNINDLLTIKAELQQFQHFENSYDFDLNKFIDIYGHTPLISENEIKSKKAQIIWLYIQYIYNFIKHDYFTSFDFIAQQHNLYKNFPDFFSRDEYLQLMNNFLYCCSLTKNEKMFNLLMEELINLKTMKKDEINYINKLKIYRTLTLYHQLSEFKKAEKLAVLSEKYLEENDIDLVCYENKIIYFNIIRAYIDNNNFEAVIRISNFQNMYISYELNSSMFKLFEFIAHYKLGNYENLLYSVNSWTKTIRSKRKQFPIEKVLIKFFRSVCNKATSEEKKQLIINTINQLKDFEKSEQKYYINHFFDFTEWFERELEELK